MATMCPDKQEQLCFQASHLVSIRTYEAKKSHSILTVKTDTEDKYPKGFS